MLKLTIALFVVFFGLAVAEELQWDKIPVALNSSQCLYKPMSKAFTCRGKAGIVECGAVAELAALGSKRFDVYGLAREQIVDGEIKAESVRVQLYPRKLDNSTYFNRTVEVDNKLVDLYLYHSEKFVESGFRVTDLKCWERLVEIFNSSLSDHVVKVGDLSEVSLFGELLVADKPVQKRWLGWGLGWGGLGWGWGFPGWGLPLWGLAWGK